MPDPTAAASKLSVQPRFEKKAGDDAVSWMWSLWEATADESTIPGWGLVGRADKLREFARQEPILAGALSSMVSKAVSLDWTIEGGRNRVLRYQELLAEAEAGQGWTVFLDRWLQDYMVCDQGGFAELGRQSKNGPVLALYNMDGAACQLTSTPKTPVRYYPRMATGGLGGKSIPLAPGEFSRIVDLPSPDESRYGLGFSAVSRALKASRILLALYSYEEERLRDMPMPGIVSVTGMTQSEIVAAHKLYDAKRQAKEQVTFKGLLWLAAQASPVNPISVNFTPFAGLPEGFDKTETYTLYIYTLALDFGVDVREFWPASQTGATKAEAEVQAQKAKGKGFGRMLSAVERALNWDVLPEGLEFAFDQKDSEDDLLRLTIQEKAIANVRKLWEPPMGGAGVITTDEARRWLVEDGLAPEWLAETDMVTARGQANMGLEDTAEDVEDMDAGGEPAEETVTLDDITAAAEKARLEPGEDFVRASSRGDVTTLWRARRVFAVPNWPVRREVAQAGPFAHAPRLPYP